MGRCTTWSGGLRLGHVGVAHRYMAATLGLVVHWVCDLLHIWYSQQQTSPSIMKRGALLHHDLQLLLDSIS